MNYILIMIIYYKIIIMNLSDGFRSCPTRYRRGIRPTNRFLRSVGTLLFGTDLCISYISVGLNRGRFGSGMSSFRSIGFFDEIRTDRVYPTPQEKSQLG